MTTVLVAVLVAFLVAAASGAAVLARRRAGMARRLANVSATLGADPLSSRTALGPAVEALERAVVRAAERETEAEEAAARLERALSVIPQGVVIYDEAGAVVFCNGPGADYLTARHGDALVEEAIAGLVAEARTEGSGSRTVDLFGPPRRSLVVRALPLDAEDEPGGVLVVIDDVSERRRVDAMRRDFVANISHELKTPVGALAVLAETLVTSADLAVTQRLAERMLDEAFRVSRTIDDLLALSRIEAEEDPVRDPVPVELVLAEAVERVHPAAEGRAIRVEMDRTDRRVTVLGDRRQLVSAVYNLLDNAVKYSEDGARVHVGARTDGQWVDVTVSDRGVGIPRRDLERVFERFYRVDRARSRDTGGTGLGLAIVRHVAGNHGGEVRVESQEGEGSTFTLRLPAGPGPVVVTSEAAG